MKAKKSSLKLTIQFVAPLFTNHKDILPSTTLRIWVQTALLNDAELTLRFVDEEEGKNLNYRYRGKDYATNVLTFAYSENEADPISGDIVLCCPVVEREASERKILIDAHYAHLIVHGVLHAQGYDHKEEDEAAEMESIEIEILDRLGFSDPYHSA
ncbi:rRNA maturation RNase YbeY [Candidatus Pandoraea novymonadis]|uniref:Endoribonuclease YbeY n=1 Tax=Candidatus Pandoraea novymonadis TaxID=1808959 RepID=A0ABX5FDB3_9BURK|nr:rRNA maturation RNase YbeY [Candidatus Pandoraea novymonadis]PSB91720.1 Endoribonuclease YbeY [Candidatus Pandoraea novymonadis]